MKVEVTIHLNSGSYAGADEIIGRTTTSAKSEDSVRGVYYTGKCCVAAVAQTGVAGHTPILKVHRIPRIANSTAAEVGGGTRSGRVANIE